MSVFILDTDQVSPAVTSMSNLANSMKNIADSAGAYDTSNDGSFDFASVARKISSNVSECYTKIQNTSVFINNVVDSHISLQSGILESVMPRVDSAELAEEDRAYKNAVAHGGISDNSSTTEDAEGVQIDGVSAASSPNVPIPFTGDVWNNIKSSAQPTAGPQPTATPQPTVSPQPAASPQPSTSSGAAARAKLEHMRATEDDKIGKPQPVVSPQPSTSSGAAARAKLEHMRATEEDKTGSAQPVATPQPSTSSGADARAKREHMRATEEDKIGNPQSTGSFADIVSEDLDYKKAAAHVPPQRVNTNDLAEEVIAGKWGNGSARVKNLTDAGYDYDAVQEMVNYKLGVSSEPQK